MRYVAIAVALYVVVFAISFARRPKRAPPNPEPFDFVAHDEGEARRGL